jgi:hypothetical protein
LPQLFEIGVLPNNLTNGTTADASQVMANFNAILSCVNVGGAARNYLAGLTLSNDVGTPNTVIDIAAGVATSDDNTTSMPVSSSVAKNANAAWAVGNTNGCLDSGTSPTASTWYHIFVIERTDTSVVDQLCSTNATAPAMPTSYTKKRRIGSFKTDGSSHILAFTQTLDTFIMAMPTQEINATNRGTSAVTRTLLGVPSGVVVEGIFSGADTVVSTDHYQLLSPLAIAAVTPSSSAFTWYALANGPGINAVAFGGEFRVLTNTAAQIRSQQSASGASDNLTVLSKGWRDFLGRSGLYVCSVIMPPANAHQASYNGERKRFRLPCSS